MEIKLNLENFEQYDLDISWILNNIVKAQNFKGLVEYDYKSIFKPENPATKWTATYTNDIGVEKENFDPDVYIVHDVFSALKNDGVDFKFFRDRTKKEYHAIMTRYERIIKNGSYQGSSNTSADLTQDVWDYLANFSIKKKAQVEQYCNYLRCQLADIEGAIHGMIYDHYNKGIENEQERIELNYLIKEITVRISLAEKMLEKFSDESKKDKQPGQTEK